MVMTREEVFSGLGTDIWRPTCWVKIGATKDGRITAGEADLKYQAGAFQGSPVQPGAMCAFAPYDLENVKVIGFDVVSQPPKVAAYRAPGAPISEYAVECVIDEVGQELGMDPIDFRLKNAALRRAPGLPTVPKFGPIGLVETLQEAKDTTSTTQGTAGRENQGRGVASGFWFNIGGETCASASTSTRTARPTLMAGTPDIGGSRASLCMMAADRTRYRRSRRCGRSSPTPIRSATPS